MRGVVDDVILMDEVGNRCGDGVDVICKVQVYNDFILSSSPIRSRIPLSPKMISKKILNGWRAKQIP